LLRAERVEEVRQNRQSARGNVFERWGVVIVGKLSYFPADFVEFLHVLAYGVDPEARKGVGDGLNALREFQPFFLGLG
jgi:hypothetical protein